MYLLCTYVLAHYKCLMMMMMMMMMITDFVGILVGIVNLTFFCGHQRDATIATN